MDRILAIRIFHGVSVLEWVFDCELPARADVQYGCLRRGSDQWLRWRSLLLPGTIHPLISDHLGRAAILVALSHKRTYPASYIWAVLCVDRVYIGGGSHAVAGGVYRGK